MKKIYLLVLSMVFICTSSAFAECNCHKTPVKQNCSSPCKPKCNHCDKPAVSPCEKNISPCDKPVSPCEQEMYSRACPVDGFLCTNKDKACIYREIGLSETQICTADKIQDKYELEVMSLNEKIKCEQQNLNDLARNCASAKDKRRVNRDIKDLKKERKDICKCYEKQFEAILSDDQRHAYRKAKKN